MLGLNLLVRLGRRVLAGPVAGSGLLPASYYRHLALAAMEAEDFPGALDYLRWAEDPLLAQLLVLRLRLLADRHGRRRQVLSELLQEASGTGFQPVPFTGQRPVPLRNIRPCCWRRSGHLSSSGHTKPGPWAC